MARRAAHRRDTNERPQQAEGVRRRAAASMDCAFRIVPDFVWEKKLPNVTSTSGNPRVLTKRLFRLRFFLPAFVGCRRLGFDAGRGHGVMDCYLIALLYIPGNFRARIFRDLPFFFSFFDRDRAVAHLHDGSGDLIILGARGENGAAQGQSRCGQ
jgi:hypothetical protein